MKYLVLVGDGMGDRPVPELGNRTPLEAAVKPNMDYIARRGICGTALPTPPSMVPESDTANLALLGYDPEVYSKGRSPLEALSMGVELKDDDTAIRCNLVTLSEDEGVPYERQRMLDHSAGELDTETARQLIAAVDKAMGFDNVRRFHCGMSYRHCLVWNNCPQLCDFTRPHDIIGREIGEYLPASPVFRELTERSYELLKSHPLNLRRKSEGKNPANSIWLWSPGVKPALPLFGEKTGLTGAVVAAVDLIKGIAVAAGLDTIKVEGADGTANTNYMGKALAGAAALEDHDFVYIHVEAPDECGHRGEAENKTKAIESIDAMLGLLLGEIKRKGYDCRIMLCCDHPTPIELRTHSHEPIPFVIYDTSKDQKSQALRYTEKEAGKGVYLPKGSELLELLLER